MRLLLSCGTLFHLPLMQVAEIARDARFDGIEVIVGRDDVTTRPEALLAASRHARLPVPVLHTPFWLFPCPGWPADERGRLLATVDLAREVGAGTVVLHVPIYGDGPYTEWFDASMADLQAELDVRVAVENMPVRAALGGSRFARRLFRLLGRGERARRALFPALDGVPRPLRRLYESPRGAHRNADDYLLGLRHLVFDTGHALLTGVDPAAFIGRAGERLAHVHLSDVSGGVDHRLPFTGELDVGGVFAALARTGYRGDVTLEAHPACFGWSRSRGLVTRALSALVERLRPLVAAPPAPVSN